VANHQQTFTDIIVATAGVGFPIMAWFNVVAAALAIPVALLSIAVLAFRLKKEWKNRRFSDRPVAHERRKPSAD